MAATLKKKIQRVGLQIIIIASGSLNQFIL